MLERIVVWRWLVVTACLAGVAAHAEDAAQRKAREELERQLAGLVEKPPTRVKVEFLGLDDPNYALQEATFELDGHPLKAPSVTVLEPEGAHLVWTGDVAPGKHVITVRVVYANGASAVFSDEGGFKWKVSGDVTFDVNAGIEVQVRVVPERDGSQKDVSKRIRLHLPAKPVMVAKLEDGQMPEPPPVVKVPAAVDAGVPLVAGKRGDAGVPVAKAPAVVDAGAPPAVAALVPPEKAPRPVRPEDPVVPVVVAAKDPEVAQRPFAQPPAVAPEPKVDAPLPPVAPPAAVEPEQALAVPEVVDAGAVAPVAAVVSPPAEEGMSMGAIIALAGFGLAFVGLVVLLLRRRQ